MRSALIRLAAVLCAASLASLASCSNSPTTPSSSAPYSQVDLLIGTGDEAVTGKTLSVNYTGWLYDPTKPDNKGLLFDTSEGRDPLKVLLGAGSVIEGFDKGLVGMKVGGIRRLVIPPSLGYGNVRTSAIPPYSTLVFDVALIEIVTQ